MNHRIKYSRIYIRTVSRRYVHGDVSSAQTPIETFSDIGHIEPVFLPYAYARAPLIAGLYRIVSGKTGKVSFASEALLHGYADVPANYPYV
jgi:hypothetical protein